MTENFKTYFMDIMSVLLPGGLAILILFQVDSIHHYYLRSLNWPDIKWLQEAVYFGASYTAGHFVFFIGSFLDEIVYDKLGRTRWANKTLVDSVIALKEKQSAIEHIQALNAFKWSCAWLLMNKPESYELVERYTAESKFFRSLVVVLILGSLVFYSKDFGRQSLICLILTLPALIRYLTQRRKSIETAYQQVIIATGMQLGKLAVQ